MLVVARLLGRIAMGELRRWVRPWAMGSLASVAAACGSSADHGHSAKPDAGELTDASQEAAAKQRPSSGGAGAGGGAGVVGAVGAGGVPSTVVGGAPGAGCALGADATTDLPSDGPGADPSLVMDAFDAGAKDATVRDAGARDAGAHDAAVVHDAGTDASAGIDGGATPVSYPPLQFSKIGKTAVIANQFLFTEGPVWSPTAQALFFTDINADLVYRLTLPDTLEVAIDHIGNADGLALDPDGNLIGAGFVSRDIWRFDGSKVRSLVGDYRGRKLNSPDDLIARSDGTIYFTDPQFGIDGSQGFNPQAPELCFQGVYRLTASALHLEDTSTVGPNGIDFSPDEKTLYVSYTNIGQVYRFDVAPDGSLHTKTLFATVTLSDSMCVDAGGNVYVASFAGITVLDPRGKQLGVIPTTGQIPTNCAFGGPDQRTFFITARTGLAGTPTKGNSSLLRIDDMPIPGIPGRP